MCLQPTPIEPVPEETARVARAAFPKGNVYLQMRDVLGALYDDRQFADLFAQRGRPAEAPWRLALVTVMQFAEGLSDRQAAEAVRARIDWKYALALTLSDAGFDFSVLCEFRARLVAGAAEQRLLDALLEACKQRGYLKGRGRQRTDSTHVLGLLRNLNRIERVAETLRAALNALAQAAPDWLRERVPVPWYERYGRRIEDYRLPKGQEARQAYVAQVGADGQQLLASLLAENTPEALRNLPAVVRLREIWEQQFERREPGRVDGIDRPMQLRDPKALPRALEMIESPYEPEARFATKRGRHWTGYKVHLTETCDEALPHVVTQVTTTLAPATDVAYLLPIQDALAARGLLPAEHLVDAGYVRARNVILSRERHHIDLVGPVDTDHQWQARVQGGFVTERFQIDWDHHQARCPRNHGSIRWCETHTARQRGMIHIEFDPADCLPCPDRARCTRSKTGSRARSITIQSRDEQEVLVAGRARQQTPEFTQLYAHRAGIEGTLSQGVRAFGLRQARYRGLRKTHLQQLATATAMNLGRLSDWLNHVPIASTRHSPFVQLAPAS
jgi:transposase